MAKSTRSSMYKNRYLVLKKAKNMSCFFIKDFFNKSDFYKVIS